MKGKIEITNVFLDRENGDHYYIGCNILEGTVEKGDSLIINEHFKLPILFVESPIEEVPQSKILSVHLAAKPDIKLHQLRNQIYSVA